MNRLIMISCCAVLAIGLLGGCDSPDPTRADGNPSGSGESDGGVANTASLEMNVTTESPEECYGTLAARLSVSGGSGSNRYSLGGEDADLFEIRVDSGELRLKAPQDLLNGKPEYHLTVTVSDGTGVSVSEELAIRLTPWKIEKDGVEYGCVVSPYTGKIWLDRNLGAAQACDGLEDVACFGDYYQWGRAADGHQDSTSALSSSLSQTLDPAEGEFIYVRYAPYDWLKSSVDGNGSKRHTRWMATDDSSICPVGFRVPEFSELEDELSVNGADIQNRSDAFRSFLKLPSAGRRVAESGDLHLSPGGPGYLWSATPDTEYMTSGYYTLGLGYAQSWVVKGPYNRADGIPVRCIHAP